MCTHLVWRGMGGWGFWGCYWGVISAELPINTQQTEIVIFVRLWSTATFFCLLLVLGRHLYTSVFAENSCLMQLEAMVM